MLAGNINKEYGENMTGSVNFNPFVKNIQFVDLEQYEEIVEKEQSHSYGINGDSQDEDVQIRLMSAETERNYKAAKKHGMREEIPNDMAALKKELKKYIEVFSQNYSRQHPNVSPNSVERFLDGIDNEFLARYMQEVKGDRTIVMSDAVQEFEIYAKQKAEQMDKGRNAAKNMLDAEKSRLGEKFVDLYKTVLDSTSSFSQRGSSISSDEQFIIRDKASEYIVNEYLNHSLILINTINPSFINSSEYLQLSKILARVNDMQDPQNVKNAIGEAKALIQRVLSDSSINKIINSINDQAENPPGKTSNIISSMTIDRASDVKDQYGDLYAAAKKASSLFSIGGRHVTNQEEKELKRKTADLVVSQLLNDQTSIGLLKALVPNYKIRPEYQRAMKILAGIEYETNPNKVNQRLNDAKNEIMKLLRHTDGEDIANVVKFSAHMAPPPGMHGPHKGHGPGWHESFQDRFEVSRNQHRLFNAAQDIYVPAGFVFDTKDFFGRPRSLAMKQISNQIKDYIEDLKLELRFSTHNRNDLNKIYEALDTAFQNFDIKDYISKHENGISTEEICRDFLHAAQGVLANQNKVENMMEAGSDPFNRNLMDSKYLVESSGLVINGREKEAISKPYAKYLLQAIMSDIDNARLLSSLGRGSFFNRETMSYVSVDKCIKNIQNLKNNPPASMREFAKQVDNITRDLQFLIQQMNGNILGHQIRNQGAQW